VDTEQATARPIASVPLGEVFAVPGDSGLLDVVLYESVEDSVRDRLIGLWRATSDARPSVREHLSRRALIPLGVELDGVGRLVVVRVKGDVLPGVRPGLDQSSAPQGAGSTPLLELARMITPITDPAQGGEESFLSMSSRRALAEDLLRLIEELGRLGIVPDRLTDRTLLVRGRVAPEAVFVGSLEFVAQDADRLFEARRAANADAAALVWRLLVGVPGSIPDRATVGLFDLIVGQPFGGVLVDLADGALPDAASRLQRLLLVGIEAPIRRALVASARATGFAAPVIRLDDFGLLVDDEDVRSTARRQAMLEQQIAVATGARRRELRRELRRMVEAFEIDVAPHPDDTPVPTSIRELEQLVLDARFDELVLQFYDGVIPALELHPWLGRALARSLAAEPVPGLTVTAGAPTPEIRVEWPATQHLNVLIVKVRSADAILGEVTLERAESGRSVIVRHPFSSGVAFGGQHLEVRAGVRAPSGLVIEAPDAAIVSAEEVAVRGQRALPKTDAARGSVFLRRFAPGAAARLGVRTTGGAVLDDVLVLFPPPPPPRDRARRRRVRLVLAAAILGIVGTGTALWLTPSMSPTEVDARIEMVAIIRPVGVEVTVAVRDRPALPGDVIGLRLQRRDVGDVAWTDLPSWFAVGARSDPSRARTLWVPDGLRGPETMEYRVVAELATGDRAAGSPVRPAFATGMRRQAPPPTWTRHEATGESFIIAWNPPELGPSSIVRHALVVVRHDNGITRRQYVGDTSLEVASVEGSRAATAQVRITSSDGIVTGWSPPLRLRFPADGLLAASSSARNNFP